MVACQLPFRKLKFQESTNQLQIHDPSYQGLLAQDTLLFHKKNTFNLLPSEILQDQSQPSKYNQFHP